MSRLLFEMTEDDLEQAVQEHYQRMYDDYYHTNEPDPCCKNCRYYARAWNGQPSQCECEDKYTDEDESYATVDEDDYCDEWEGEED